MSIAEIISSGSYAYIIRKAGEIVVGEGEEDEEMRDTGFSQVTRRWEAEIMVYGVILLNHLK